MIRSKFFPVICAFMFTFIFAVAQPVSAAYDLSYMYIQHRVNEDGTEYNRLYFELKDDQGQYVANDIVTNVKLYDPNDGDVNFSDPSFEFWPEFHMKRYDADNGTWVDDSSSTMSGYGSTIYDSLIAGTYRLEVTTDDGQTHGTTFEFYQSVRLPVIESNSFQLHPDVFGNVFWTWEVPDEFCRISKLYDTSNRLYIMIYNNQEESAFYYYKIPTHMNRLFIASDVVEEMKSKGNSIRLVIQPRTNDNNARSTSNTLIVEDLLAYYPYNQRAQVNAFVTRFYQLCLNREPEQSGLDSWVDLLMDGSMTGADLANSFIFSPEFLDKGTTNAEFLRILYEAFFNRAPDTGGYNSWYTNMNNGMGRMEVLNGFTGAQEFFNLCQVYGITAR